MLVETFIITVITGDLYFEKAVNGFLSDLFAKWKVGDFLLKRIIECNSFVYCEYLNFEFYDSYFIVSSFNNNNILWN